MAPTMTGPADGILCLCITEPPRWRSSGRGATVSLGRCRPPPRSAPSAPPRPSTAAPILRTSARVRVPVSPSLRLPSSSPPFNALSRKCAF